MQSPSVVPSRFSRRDSMRFFGFAGLSALLGSGASALALESPAAADTELQGAGYFKTTLGKATLYLVSDGGFPMDPSALFPDVSDDDVKAAKREAFIEPDVAVPGHVNTFLIEEGSNRILVDTGCGAGMGPTTGKLVRNLKRAGFDADAITHVVITHAHPDHIGGLVKADGALAFPNAAVLISRVEHEFWTGNPQMPSAKLPAEMIKGMVQLAQGTLGAAKAKLELVAPDDAIGGVIKVVDAAGHTPGHVALRIESEGAAMLYVTDAVHVPSLQLAKPGWQILFDADPNRAAETRAALLETAVRDRLLIAGAHIPFPGMGHVASQQGGYRFVPKVWEW